MSDVPELEGKIMLITEIFEKDGIPWARLLFEGRMTKITFTTLMTETKEI